MTLIDGDRIITAQLYDDEHEEFIEQKMSIIDNINAYTNEGITEADIVEQTRWIPVSEGLPKIHNYMQEYIVTIKGNFIRTAFFTDMNGKQWWSVEDVIAWMPLPKPYEPQESENKE